MSESERRPESGVESYDRELDLKAIAATGIGLALVVVVFAGLMWPVSSGLRSKAAELDRPTPRLPEARVQPPPPEPRLQTSPEADLVALEAEEDALLHGYAWIDEAAGRARVPVERAMELLVERGWQAAGGETPGAEEDGTAAGVTPEGAPVADPDPESSTQATTTGGEGGAR